MCTKFRTLTGTHRRLQCIASTHFKDPYKQFLNVHISLCDTVETVFGFFFLNGASPPAPVSCGGRPPRAGGAFTPLTHLCHLNYISVELGYAACSRPPR
jgi:hypothetical protein